MKYNSWSMIESSWDVAVHFLFHASTIVNDLCYKYSSINQVDSHAPDMPWHDVFQDTIHVYPAAEDVIYSE